MSDRESPSSGEQSVSTTVDDAIDLTDKDAFWQAVHDGFARLRADPVAWSEYLAETALWDTASNDGLEDEEPYFTEPIG